MSGRALALAAREPMEGKKLVSEEQREHDRSKVERSRIWGWKKWSRDNIERDVRIKLFRRHNGLS